MIRLYLLIFLIFPNLVHIATSPLKLLHSLFPLYQRNRVHREDAASEPFYIHQGEVPSFQLSSQQDTILHPHHLICRQSRFAMKLHSQIRRRNNIRRLCFGIPSAVAALLFIALLFENQDKITPQLYQENSKVAEMRNVYEQQVDEATINQFRALMGG